MLRIGVTNGNQLNGRYSYHITVSLSYDSLSYQKFIFRFKTFSMIIYWHLYTCTATRREESQQSRQSTSDNYNLNVYEISLYHQRAGNLQV